MEKHLKCAYSEWEGNVVQPMRLDQLWQSVPIAPVHNGQEFFAPVKNDIQQNGLHFPVIVVECTFKQLQEQKLKYKDRILDLPADKQPTDLVYAIWGGSNRYAAAVELGYDTVDCIIIPNADFPLAFRYQSLHRKGFPQYYTRRPSTTVKQ